MGCQLYNSIFTIVYIVEASVTVYISTNSRARRYIDRTENNCLKVLAVYFTDTDLTIIVRLYSVFKIEGLQEV